MSEAEALKAENELLKTYKELADNFCADGLARFVSEIMEARKLSAEIASKDAEIERLNAEIDELKPFDVVAVRACNKILLHDRKRLMVAILGRETTEADMMDDIVAKAAAARTELAAQGG